MRRSKASSHDLDQLNAIYFPSCPAR